MAKIEETEKINWRKLVLIILSITALFDILVYLVFWPSITWMIVLTLIVIAIFLVRVYAIYVFFAPRELLYMGMEEGKIRAVMRGPKGKGAFVRFEMSYKKHTFDNDWNIIEGNEEYLLGGIRWLGIPGIDHIYYYWFAWTSKLENGTLKPSREFIGHINAKADTYVTTIEGVEVGGSMVPVDIELLVTLIIINPYKALFTIENWLEMVMNRIKVPVKDWIGQQKDPEVFITQKGILGDLFMQKIKDSGDYDFFENFGVKIIKVEPGDVNLGDFQETALTKWKFEQEGLGKIAKETAEGNAYEARRLRETRADAGYFTEIIKLGEAGLVLKFLETLEKAGQKGNTIIIPLGSVKDAAKQFGLEGIITAELFKKIPGATKDGVPVEGVKKVIEAEVTKKGNSQSGQR